MLEEPFFASAVSPTRSNLLSSPSSLYGMYDGRTNGLTPTTRVHEEGNNYLVEAEMPGVKKENLAVEFSEGGELLHISGTRGSKISSSSKSEDAQQISNTNGGETAGTEANDNANADASTEVTNEASPGSSSVPNNWFSEGFSYGTFSNTFRFPRPVDVSQVQAKYEDGVLRITVPKLEKVEERKAIEIQ